MGAPGYALPETEVEVSVILRDGNAASQEKAGMEKKGWPVG
jgi:hypothetical protein